jgi:anti-sigma factor RsiW
MTRVDDEMLMAYVDGEIDAATARRIERAIASDPKMAERARLFRDSAMLLRGAYADALHEKVPERLVATIRSGPARKAEIVTPPRRRQVRQFIGWAVAASLAALVVGSGSTYLYMTEEAANVEEDVQATASDRWLDHVVGFYDVYEGARTKENHLLVDFKADDIPKLKQWFGARLNRNLSVPDLSTLGFQPQGGRLLIINGRPAAQLLYMSDRGELVGLVIAFTPQNHHDISAVRRHNVNVVYWRNAGYAYALVGTIEPDRLRKLAEKAWNDLART